MNSKEMYTMIVDKLKHEMDKKGNTLQGYIRFYEYRKYDIELVKKIYDADVKQLAEYIEKRDRYSYMK